MKKSKRLRLLALLLAICSVVAIVSGCNKETPTTGDPSGQQSTSTAPEPSTTIAPEPTADPEPTEPEEEQKYYLSGTWLMNETLEPLAELTGKTQKESLNEQLWFYAGGKRFCARISWSFSYLNYEGGFTSKTLKFNVYDTLKFENVYAEGKAIYEYKGWEHPENRTIVFANEPNEEFEVSKDFYLWFTKNAVKVSEDRLPWIG